MKISESDETFMNFALAQARMAFSLGEVPVGAVLVREGEIIAEGFNRRETWSDSTAHAEILVIQQASRKLKGWRLSDCSLYVTLEPCPMCAGALVQARIPRLIFGAFDPKGGGSGSLFNIPEDDRLNHRTLVTSGCLENECAALLKAFFGDLRKRTFIQPGV